MNLPREPIADAAFLHHLEEHIVSSPNRADG